MFSWKLHKKLTKLFNQSDRNPQYSLLNHGNMVWELLLQNTDII